MHSQKEKAAVVVHYLRHFVTRGDRILDVGCGTGQYREVTEGNYTGLDLTDEEYAPGFPRRVDVVGLATAIPLPAESVDLVFTVGVFYLVDDPEKALAEFLRVLRPGGRLVLFDYNWRTLLRLALRGRHFHSVWTQRGLRRKVERAGFHRATILSTRPDDPSWSIWKNELRGTWSVVTAVK